MLMLKIQLSQQLVGVKTSSKIEQIYLDKFVGLLVFILPKMSGHKTFKVKDGDKDKSNN